MNQTRADEPVLRPVGVDGLLVSFADTLTEPANRAALALAASLRAEGWGGVEEVSSTLVSTYIRFDPLHLAHDTLRGKLKALLGTRDWYTASLPDGRRAWTIPTVYGEDAGPQLDDAAAEAGMSPQAAVRSLSEAEVRVQTIGFAPGQPYLGPLGPEWDLPRLEGLTPKVPEGALVQAIRQFVLFAVSAPTGWRHVGQTAIRLFRPEAENPFVLRPGDMVRFAAVTPEEMANIRRQDRDGLGGATARPVS